MKPFKIFNGCGNLIAGFSSRQDGNMDVRFDDEATVAANRARFLDKIGVAENRIVQAKLVHGDDIIEINEGHLIDNQPLECDALISKVKNIFLSFRTADCLPIYYYDPARQTVALAHCGWQSTDKHLAEKVVQRLVSDFGCAAKDILVAMGPAIHRESYCFDEPETKNRANWQKYLTSLPNGSIMIDNIQYNVDQLLGAGISRENLEISEIDTGADAGYFSHYRSKRGQEKDGRFINIIGLKG
jgi:YfiH family protein